jgi:hypothetical protein
MVLERASALLPKAIRLWASKEIIYAGMNAKPEELLGFLVCSSTSLASVSFLICFYLLNLGLAYSLAYFLIIGIVLFGFSLFWISNIADSRGNAVEKILPDALELIASNIKSGLTTERAIFVSARPEFGALSIEFKETSKKILVGERIEKALLGIALNIKSKVLERTVWLIAEGIKNGGQISNLLIQLSNDLREENALKAEVNANVSMYVMLIFFSAAFGAPMLFGISSFIVGVMGEQTGNIHINQGQIQEYSSRSPALSLVGIPTSTISENFIVLFSVIVLIITSIFSSMILGIITSGSEKNGAKFLPVLFVVSLVLFFIVRTMLKTAFGGMIV